MEVEAELNELRQSQTRPTNMSTTLAQVKRETLEKRRASLLEEYEVANAQLDRMLSEVDRVKLQRQIDALEDEIKGVERQLEELEASSSSEGIGTVEQKIIQPQKRPASDQLPSTNCPPPPKPGDLLLDQFRYDTPEMILSSIESAKERLHLVGEKIDYYRKLKLENPLLAAGGEVELQIKLLKKEAEELQRELDEQIPVLCWKLYKVCQECASLESQLEELVNRRSALEREGKYVPHELKSEIKDARERIREINVITRKAGPYCG